MTLRHRALSVLFLAGLAAACAAPARRVVSPPPQQARPPTSEAGPGAAKGPAVVGPTPIRGAQAPAAEPSPSITQAPPGGPMTPRPGGVRSGAQPPGRGRQIVLNFDNADIEAVIQAASEIVGFNYTLGPGVAGKKVTVQTSGRIPEDEVFNVLLAVLEVHGVTAIRSGNLYKIVPVAAARERPVPTVIGSQSDPTRRDDEVIMQIVPVAFVPADRIAGAIRSYVQGGNVVVHGNLLIITDTAGNIARLLQIVAVLDVEGTVDELRIIQVRYADAIEIAKVLNDFFTGRRVRTSTPTAAPRPGVTISPGAATPGGDAPERPPLVLSDKRTNTLIVSARRTDMEIISQLLGQLDVDTQANKRVFIYYVENVKAKELAGTLSEIFGKPSREGEAAGLRRETGPGGLPPGYTGPGATLGIPTTVAGSLPGAAGQPGTEAEPGVVEGQVKVVSDEPNNALIITTFPRNWPLIEDTIRKLDRTPKQVLIEVLVAEITLDDEMDLGIEWTIRTQKDVTIGGKTYNLGSVTRLDVGPTAPGFSQSAPPGLPALPVATPALQGLSFFLFETDRFLGLLNLYANYGKVNVLSSPHILTSENKKAIINVSNSIPIVTGQTVSQSGTVQTQSQQPPSSVLSQTVEYKDAGIILTVTPRISDKRVVALDVKQTVNDVGPQQPPSGSPIIIKREAETSVVLHDNQTLVLGGLIQTRIADTRTGIPGLSRIPVLGFLFGAQKSQIRRTELLLLITPRVIGDPSEARDLLEQLRGQRPDLVRTFKSFPNILKPSANPPVVAPQPEPVAPAAPVPEGVRNER